MNSNKKIIISSILFLFLISLVSSNVDIKFNIYEGIIENNSFTGSANRVSGFNVVAYTCANAECSAVKEKVTGLSKSSNQNYVILNFPTKLKSEHGYLLYFFKEGYIGHEEYGIKISGKGDQIYEYSKKIYLSRKTSGKAEIKNLNIVQTRDGFNVTQLFVSYGVSSSGTSEDLILDVRNAKNYPLEESIKVNSFIHLINEDGEIVSTIKETDFIEYSGEIDKLFKISVLETGNYSLNVTTEIDDLKVINPKNDSRVFHFVVDSLEEKPEDKSYHGYSNITNVSIVFPEIKVGMVSKKVNNSGEIDVDSEIYFLVSKEGVEIDSKNKIIPVGDIYFEYDFNFVEPGTYGVNITVCPVLDENTTCDNQSYTIVIKKEQEEEIYSGYSNITDITVSNSTELKYNFVLEQESKKTNQTDTYNVTSNLTIKIFNESGLEIYSNETELATGEEKFEFNYIFNSPGTYNVSFELCPNLETNFTCSQKNITIVIPEKEPELPEDESYYGYSNITNVSIVFPEIKVGMVSKKVNNSGEVDVDSEIYFLVSKEGFYKDSEVKRIPVGEIYFEYDFNFAEPGTYGVNIEVCPVLEGNVTCDKQSYTIVIHEELEEEIYSGYSNITDIAVSNSTELKYNFTIEQESKKTNQTGKYDVNSTLTIEIFRENESTYNSSKKLGEGEKIFEFDYEFSAPGNYTISFTVCPDLKLDNACSQKNITIVIPEKESDKKDSEKKCCSTRKMKEYDEDYEDEVDGFFYNEITTNSLNKIEEPIKENNKRKREFVFYWTISVLVLSLVLVLILIAALFKKDL